MTQEPFYERSIPIRGLRKNKLNYFRLSDEVEVVVLELPGDTFRVLRDVCPHMGGPLSQGWYRPADKTLHCPWHGYIFDVESCAFTENPNEAVYACMRTPSSSFKPYPTPRYKLPALEYERNGDELFIRRTSSR